MAVGRLFRDIFTLRTPASTGRRIGSPPVMLDLPNRLTPANNRLSAAMAMPQSGSSPFPVLPIKNESLPKGNNDLEETHKPTKRSSSVGSAFKRLFSRSPVHVERSSSETSMSVLGAEQTTPQESTLRAGHRGRTPPRTSTTSSPTVDYNNLGEVSSLLPNNPYYCPIKQQRNAFETNMGGLLRAHQTH